MDLADRYVNTECTKRMLQVDQVTLTEKTAALFTKEGEQHNSLHDMQSMWYELASGESYFCQGDIGRALKKFLALEKHYADDRLHSHCYFQKAAHGAIRCYIKMYDVPSKSSAEEDDDLSKLPASEKKKLRQKQRKAEARAKKEAEVKNEESNVNNASKSGKRNVKPVDPDPVGEKLLQTIRYISERVVGQGSFGLVFQAKCLEIGENVAIKVHRELQTMRLLYHPKVYTS